MQTPPDQIESPIDTGGFLREPAGGSTFVAMMWMLLLTIALVWLPLVGPFLAGVVGGRKAGGVGAAIVAALLPAFFFAIAIVVVATVVALPVVGFIRTSSLLGIVILATGIALIAGAIVGAIARQPPPAE